jgi:hypothetical protein
MAFEKGNRAAKRRKKKAGGRPTKAQAAEKESFRQALERKREERAEELAGAYYDMALADPATMRHAVDKVLPTLTEENIIAPPIINFLQFSSPKLPASGIPPPVLVGNGRGEEAGVRVVPPALKFHGFSKRRK